MAFETYYKTRAISLTPHDVVVKITVENGQPVQWTSSLAYGVDLKAAESDPHAWSQVHPFEEPGVCFDLAMMAMPSALGMYAPVSQLLMVLAVPPVQIP